VSTKSIILTKTKLESSLDSNLNSHSPEVREKESGPVPSCFITKIVVNPSPCCWVDGKLTTPLNLLLLAEMFIYEEISIGVTT